MENLRKVLRFYGLVFAEAWQNVRKHLVGTLVSIGGVWLGVFLLERMKINPSSQTPHRFEAGIAAPVTVAAVVVVGQLIRAPWVVYEMAVAGSRAEIEELKKRVETAEEEARGRSTEIVNLRDQLAMTGPELVMGFDVDRNLSVTLRIGNRSPGKDAYRVTIDKLIGNVYDLEIEEVARINGLETPALKVTQINRATGKRMPGQLRDFFAKVCEDASESAPFVSFLFTLRYVDAFGTHFMRRVWFRMDLKNAIQWRDVKVTYDPIMLTD